MQKLGSFSGSKNCLDWTKLCIEYLFYKWGVGQKEFLLQLAYEKSLRLFPIGFFWFIFFDWFIELTKSNQTGHGVTLGR